MYKNEKILVGKSNDKEIYLIPKMANRHGLITGASGSGKTITLKVLAESFADANIPVFLSDVKGDLAGCAVSGSSSESLEKRLKNLKIKDFDYKSYPVVFWDLFELNGHPIRTTIKNIGPDILSIMLGLSEAQEGVLSIVFQIAEDENLDLIDLKDLKSALQFIGDNRKDYITKYGNITTQSIGVIQRSLLSLERQGADKFFGEPALDIFDFIKRTNDIGNINILHAVELFNNPDLYVSFLLWLLIELFNKLPEVGDLDKPKMIFFFDEAHLLFNGLPTYRLKKIVQIVKLIRSRGVGLYFISQKPTDIPNEVLSQLSNRVQHTLRAYTPAEQKVVKVAAEAFRVNPNFNTEEAILSLGTGEALISFLNEKGEPEIVEKATILPPQSAMGTIDDLTRNKFINNSPLVGKYDERQDNISAHEKITEIEEEENKKQEEEKRKIEEEKLQKEQAKEEARIAKENEKAKKEAERARKNNPAYKLGKKVVSKAENKIINKVLNAIIKKISK